MFQPVTAVGREFARLMAEENDCIVLREATPLEILQFNLARSRSLMRGRKRRRPKVKVVVFNSSVVSLNFANASGSFEGSLKQSTADVAVWVEI